MKKLLALLLALAMIVALATGCGDKAGNAGDAPKEPAAVKDSAKVQIGVEPSTLDTHNTADLISHMLNHDLHGCLVRINNEGEIVGDLAESFTWNDDFSQLTFQLRDGIKFSDGSDITVEDVKFSFERGMASEFAATYYSYVESVSTNGDKEVTVKLNQPYSAFLSAMTSTYFIVLSKAAMDGGMDLATLPNVTSGPYTVESWQKGAGMTLKANENYYRGAAAVKTVELQFITDENTALIALESGDIDYMMGTSGLSGSNVEYVGGLESCSLLPFSSTAYNFLSLNQNVEYFADKNVRKAIDCAINRADIISIALDGNGTPAGIPVVPGLGGYVDGYEATAYDLEAAKKYMAESAYPDGFTFTIQSAMADWTKVAQVIQDNLKELNITVEIQEMEVGTVITNLTTNNYEAAVMSWSNGSGDVSNVASMYIAGDGMCFANFTDPTLGEKFNESLMYAGEQRGTILKEVYDMIMEEVPYISLYWPTSYYATAKDLTVADNIGILGEMQFYSMSWNQ